MVRTGNYYSTASAINRYLSFSTVNHKWLRENGNEKIKVILIV